MSRLAPHRSVAPGVDLLTLSTYTPIYVSASGSLNVPQYIHMRCIRLTTRGPSFLLDQQVRVYDRQLAHEQPCGNADICDWIDATLHSADIPLDDLPRRIVDVFSREWDGPRFRCESCEEWRRGGAFNRADDPSVDEDGTYTQNDGMIPT